MSCRRKPNYIYLIQEKEIRKEKLFKMIVVDVDGVDDGVGFRTAGYILLFINRLCLSL